MGFYLDTDRWKLLVSYVSRAVLLTQKSFECAGHLMEKIDSLNLLHRAFSVFLFNSKYELLLQVYLVLWCTHCI